MIQQMHFWVLFPKELKAGAQIGIRTPSFIAKLFTTAKRWKQPKCPLAGEHVNKMLIKTHNGLLLNLKKE